MISRRFYWFVFLLLFPLGTYAQDTLYVSPRGADSLFIARNLSLLAAKYNIDINRTLVKQARIWDNPSFTAELNLYNPTARRWFDVGSGGQKIFSVEQVIQIAGQRGQGAKWAKENVKISEYDFLDLIRTLKFSLHQNLYSLYFNRQTIASYNRQLGLLDTIIKAYDEQFKKGNIPLKESMRLKSIYYRLNNDKTVLQNQVYDEESVLRVLLGSTLPVAPVISDADLRRYNKTGIAKDDLVKQAVETRPDLKKTESAYNQSLINVELQKREAVPNLRIGGLYDQAGSYVNNYSGITLGIDLPVFNRNQANIKMAKFQSMQAAYALANDSLRVSSEVTAAWDKLVGVEDEYRRIDADFMTQFELLNRGITDNFTKRNISLLEFVDLFEAYNETIAQLNIMQINRILAYEELNYSVGVELFKRN